MKRYTDCPNVLRDFLTYHETIKGQSSLTISESSEATFAVAFDAS